MESFPGLAYSEFALYLLLETGRVIPYRCVGKHHLHHRGLRAGPDHFTERSHKQRETEETI